jgi:hypothetical protein
MGSRSHVPRLRPGHGADCHSDLAADRKPGTSRLRAPRPDAGGIRAAVVSETPGGSVQPESSCSTVKTSSSKAVSNSVSVRSNPMRRSRRKRSSVPVAPEPAFCASSATSAYVPICAADPWCAGNRQGAPGRGRSRRSVLRPHAKGGRPRYSVSRLSFFPPRVAMAVVCPRSVRKQGALRSQFPTPMSPGGGRGAQPLPDRSGTLPDSSSQ